MKIIILSAVYILLFLSVKLTAQERTISEENVRQKIRSALFIPEKLPDPDVEFHGKFFPMKGVDAERISYTNRYGMKVPAIIYLPDPRPAGKVPGIIIVNGHGGDKYSWYSFYSGMLFAKGGAVVLTYDPVGEGERNINRKSGTRAHDLLQDPPEMGQRLGGLMVTDVMQAVSCLSQRPEVDANRIAAMGYSMGSFVLALAGAVEKRLHAVVLAGGGNLDGLDGVWDKSKPMCQGIPYQSLSFLGDRPAAIYSLHASRGPLLIYNGLQDSTVSVPMLGTWSFFDNLYKRTEYLRGSTDGLFEYAFTEGGHRPNFVTKPVIAWLEKQIDFPLWTESEIHAMPVTHISEWARINAVDMDKLYVNEFREGGTRALGSEIPALSRKDLSVFTEDEWERTKDKLIYEKWVEAARSEVLKK